MTIQINQNKTYSRVVKADTLIIITVIGGKNFNKFSINMITLSLKNNQIDLILPYEWKKSYCEQF